MVYWRSLGIGLSGMMLAAAVIVYAAPPPAQPNIPAAIPDRGKGGIELPTKNFIAQSRAVQAQLGERFVNPKVEPGKVKWHATFEEACQASAKSGKPVMLFQMMGKLDDQFC
jgi:hypothetical protein